MAARRLKQKRRNDQDRCGDIRSLELNPVTVSKVCCSADDFPAAGSQAAGSATGDLPAAACRICWAAGNRNPMSCLLRNPKSLKTQATSSPANQDGLSLAGSKIPG